MLRFGLRSLLLSGIATLSIPALTTSCIRSCVPSTLSRKTFSTSTGVVGRSASVPVFSAECTSGDWRGYVGHYIVESLRFANENAYITLRHVGPTLEEALASLEGLKKDNPDNERIQRITLSEFAKTEVELEWFDTHKITLEADYEQQ